MCVGIPGQIIRICEADPAGMTMGTVSFGGALKEVCLACVPEARVGEYVIVHAGFALTLLNEQEAGEVFALLEQMGELGEIQPGEGA
jgi:hydrogenase expression/formation protein HypC